MASRSNRILVPQAKAAMDQFKYESAQEVGVNLSQGYNGNLTSAQAGSIGGQMVKKMIQSYEQNQAGGASTSMSTKPSPQDLSYNQIK